MSAVHLGKHQDLGHMQWRAPFLSLDDRTIAQRPIIIRLEYHQDGQAAPERALLDPALDRFSHFLAGLKQHESHARAHLTAQASPALGAVELYQVIMHAGPNLRLAKDVSDPFERRYAINGPYSLYFTIKSDLAQQAMAASSLSIGFDAEFNVIGWPVADAYRFDALPSTLPVGKKVNSVTHPWFGKINHIDYCELPHGELRGRTYRRDLQVPILHQYGFEANSLDVVAKLDQRISEIAQSARAEIGNSLRADWLMDRVTPAEPIVDRRQITEIFPNAFETDVSEAEFANALWLERIGYYPLSEEGRVMVMDFRLLSPDVDDLILVAYIGPDGSVLEAVTES